MFRFFLKLISGLTLLVLLNSCGEYTHRKSVIIDHNAVYRYDNIPAEYMTEIKKMMVNMIGASRVRGLYYGMDILASSNSDYAVNVTWAGEPEAPPDPNNPASHHLRVVRSFVRENDPGTAFSNTCNESRFWSSSKAIDVMKNHLTNMRTVLNNPPTVLGYFWTTEMNDGTLGDFWAGELALDYADNTKILSPWSVKDSSVSLDDYIAAVNELNEHQEGLENPTLVIFATSAPEGNNDRGYQRSIKNAYIRDYVRLNGGYLFDVEDILSHNGSEVGAMEAYYDDYTFEDINGDSVTEWFPLIHPDNDLPSFDGGYGNCYMSESACLNVAKAMWVLLARVAGWEG